MPREPMTYEERFEAIAEELDQIMAEEGVTKAEAEAIMDRREAEAKDEADLAREHW